MYFLIIKFNSSLNYGLIIILFFFLIYLTPCLTSKQWFFEWRIIRTRTQFNFLILFDLTRIVFLITVSTISLSVIIFRVSYMKEDVRNKRFHILVAIFILRILLLILSPNLIRALLGWDGLGLRSYLLVIHFSRRKAFRSGLITALTNRLGDFFFLVLIAFTITRNSWELQTKKRERYSLILGLLLLLTAFTKRAQVPFSSWLPAAMAAPTPVSSLVHSSTLVTAGVYLIIRHEKMFVNFNFNKYILYTRLVTTLAAGLSALKENDLKKIVALSTLRQLGMMVSLIRLGTVLIRFVHLVAHAFFKALMFISTGRIIHSVNRNQDLRFIGISYTPMTKAIHLTSNISLIGLPFMSAFFSKEIFLETVALIPGSLTEVIFILITALLTVFYAVRFSALFFMLCIKISSIRNAHDGDIFINFRILVLLPFAVFTGFNLQNSLVLISQPLNFPIMFITLVGFSVSMLLFALIFFKKMASFKKNFFTIGVSSIWGINFINFWISKNFTISFPLNIYFSDKFLTAKIKRLVFDIRNEKFIEKQFFSSVILVLLLWTIAITLIVKVGF